MSPPALNSRWLLCAHYRYHTNQGLRASMVSLGLVTAYRATSPLSGTQGPLALRGPSRGQRTVPVQQQATRLTRLRSITSCSMKRIRDDVFFSLIIFSI